MNIGLINQFYPPAQAPTGLLLADLAAELARRGHAVTVIASAAGYGAAAGADGGSVAGVRVVRVGPAQRPGAAAALAAGEAQRPAVGAADPSPKREGS